MVRREGWEVQWREGGWGGAVEGGGGAAEGGGEERQGGNKGDKHPQIPKSPDLLRGRSAFLLL